MLDPTHFFKRVHFTASLLYDDDIVDISLDVDKTLKKYIWMVSIFERRYWKINFELFTFHLKYFKDKVSDRMKTSIETCFYYLEYIKDSFIYDYFNVPIEEVNNFIKVLKRIVFIYRNFANFELEYLLLENC